ncbi:CdaR family transcriptional regulator [Tsukamurella sp. 1534]|uniref:PucR family transcriptional regulator n=1 Tax=Tsukamurella sp. 1534 TaxID=1151061 RepID=UPI0002E09819|nr:helix-turn-helix domain-containing protein [Tsukamurella sp. 1534]
MWSDSTKRTLLDLRREAPSIARETMTRYVATSTYYATDENLPEHLFRESTHSIRVFVEVTCRALLGEDVDVADALSDVLERSAERAGEGLPVGEYLRCWQTAVSLLDELLRRRVPATDQDAERVRADMRAVSDAVLRDAIDSYTRYATALAATDSDRDSATIDALFAGTPSDGDLAGAPEQPVVVLADVARSATEDTAPDERARALAARRKARSIRGRIERAVTGMWLMDIRERTARFICAPDGTDWSALAADLHRATGAEVTMAVAPAQSISDLPRAARDGSQILGAALRMGLRGCAVGIEDVALQLHLAHPSSGLATLLARCAPLIERPELVDTSRAYLRSGMDRRTTADFLGVHPNTVDNRLAKIRTLTGLDVHRADDLLTVAVAVNPARGWSDPEAPTRL